MSDIIQTLWEIVRLFRYSFIRLGIFIWRRLKILEIWDEEIGKIYEAHVRYQTFLHGLEGHEEEFLSCDTVFNTKLWHGLTFFLYFWQHFSPAPLRCLRRKQKLIILTFLFRMFTVILDTFFWSVDTPSRTKIIIRCSHETYRHIALQQQDFN